MTECRERSCHRMHYIPILFVMGTNLIIKTAGTETRGPKTALTHLPANRGFMDYLTISTESHIQARWLLLALKDNVSWASSSPTSPDAWSLER